MGLGCAALVVVGILAAFPSLGTSLLLTALGVSGGAALFAGGAAVAHGREKNLAKEVSHFRSAIEEVVKETTLTAKNQQSAVKTYKDEIIKFRHDELSSDDEYTSLLI